MWWPNRVYLTFGSALVLALLPHGRAAAQGKPWDHDLSDAQKAIVDLRWRVLEKECELSVLHDEDRALAKVPAEVPAAPEAPVPHPEEFAKQQFARPNAERLKALEKAQARLDGEREAARRDWHEAVAAALGFKQKTEQGGLLADATASTWDGGATLIILGGVALVAISILLGTHERRRQLRTRWRFRGHAGVAVTAVVCLLAASLSSCSRRSGHDAAAAHESVEARKLAELVAEVTATERRVDEKWQRLLDAERIALPFPDGFKKEFQEAEKAAHQKARELALSTRIRERALEQTRAERDALQEERERVTEQLETARVRRLWRAGIKIGLCALFIVAAFVPLRRARRWHRREIQLQSRQCPRCLATDTLKQKATEVQDERLPEPSHVECSECGYEFRGSYRRLPRFCFPTVGVPASGKTHWLVTAYDMIKNGRVPVSATIQCAPSLMDEQFDVEIEFILENHRGARATVHSAGEFPSPLLFHVEDRDRLGHNAGLLNLFDFSGEMMKMHVNTDMLRRRALLMDGFVLFVDPTKVKASKGGESIKNQVQALASFHQEIRDMRGLDVGAPVPVPVAVCISKLDLITTQNPFSTAALPWIKSLRESFAAPCTLAGIQRRSKMCEEKLSLLFPGWSLTRTLQEHFGGRFMFFPVTPVSLAENELGRTDLTRRTFAPVGILEPILWLLHMHGFDVLA